MADRLDELRKQRAVIQQHLTWLDHEIAAMTVTRLTLPPFAMRGNTRPPVPGATNAPMKAAPAAGMPIPELSEFQVDPDNVQGDTKRGCLLYSALALVIFALVLAAIYYLGYRDHPVLFVPDKSAPTMIYPTSPAKNPATPPVKPAPAAPATPPKK